MNNLREKLFDLWQRVRYGRTRLNIYWGRVYRERDGKITQIPASTIEPMPYDMGHVNSRSVIGRAIDENTVEVHIGGDLK